MIEKIWWFVKRAAAMALIGICMLFLFNVAVQVGQQGEVAIRFVLEGMKTSPVMVRSLPYHGGRRGDTEPGGGRGGAAL